jgi:uncharacterized protein YjdB
MYYKSFLSKVAGIALVALFLAGCGDDAEDSVALQSINVLPSSLTLNPGQTEQLTAIAVPENASGVSFNWTSADGTVASVTNEGRVTAVGEGSTTVTVRSGNVKKDVTVTVTLRVLTAFTVEPQTLTLTLINEPAQLTVIRTPVDAGGVFSFVSSDETVVTANVDGQVTVVGLGSAFITVSSASLSDVRVRIPVEVVLPALADFTVTPADINVSIVGARVQLAMDHTPLEAVPVYSYSSGNNDVATVSDEGLVTITGAGAGSITVTSGDITKTVPVTVSIPTPDNALNKDLWTVTASSEWNVLGNVHPANLLLDGDPFTYWHSDNPMPLPAFFTVDMKGNKLIKGIYLVHRQDVNELSQANPKVITVDVSLNAETWVTVYQTDNLSQTKDAILLELSGDVVARYFRVNVTATNNNEVAFTYLAEAGIYNDGESYVPPTYGTGNIYPLTFTEGYGLTLTPNEDGSVTLTVTGGDPQAITGPIRRQLGGTTAKFKFEFKNNRAVPYEHPTWGHMIFWCPEVTSQDGAYGAEPVEHATEWTPFEYDFTSVKDNFGFGAPTHFIRYDPTNEGVGYTITIRNLRIETNE